VTQAEKGLIFSVLGVVLAEGAFAWWGSSLRGIWTFFEVIAGNVQDFPQENSFLGRQETKSKVLDSHINTEDGHLEKVLVIM
jgi:hypothetical protein